MKNKLLSPKQAILYAVFVSAALLLNLCSAAQSGKAATPQKVKSVKTEILFIENAWDSTLKRAIAEQKYIFVDAYADWCGPCKLLKKTSFRDKKAADFFNQHFINLSIDMEKGEGLDLASKWQVDSYPTLIVFTAEGKPVLESVGFLKAEELLKFGQQALQKKVE